jgi:D-alanyl-D-alanine carboxypeptidase
MKTSRVLFLIFLVPLISIAQPASELASKIDSYLAGKFPANSPGGAVLVARGEQIILRKAYGLADKENGKFNSTETIFRIGSITKQFTSTAILKLVGEGKISLNDPITNFFPDYPMGEKPITIRHLLTHTSGIKSYTSLPEIVGSKESKERRYDVNEIINAFKSQPKDFAPGNDYLYNNSGYYLLGAIIEKVSGQSWATNLQNIFTPLEMKSTYCDDIGVEGEAIGYYKWKKEFRKADVVHPSASYAAGAIASTVDDLWKWNSAVFTGTVVSLDLLNEAWTPVKLNDGTTRPYGFGWQLSEGEPKTIGHGGTIDGYQSYSVYDFRSRIFLAILSNNMAADPQEYVNKIIEMIKRASVSPK